MKRPRSKRVGSTASTVRGGTTRSRRAAQPGPRLHGDGAEAAARGGAWAAVWAIVRAIPRGSVMTYGQIARLLDDRLSARAVGWALHACDQDLPWHRVVNARGGCSTQRRPDIPDGLQRALLEAEHVEFRADDTLELERYRFDAEGETAPAQPQRKRTRTKRRLPTLKRRTSPG